MKKYILQILASVTTILILTALVVPFYLTVNKATNETNTYTDELKENEIENTNTETETESDNTENENTNTENQTENTINLSSVMVQALVTLNVRKEPDTSSKILGTLLQFESVYYIESVNNWYQVYYKEQLAYVSSNYEYSRKYDTENNNLIENVITTGMSLLATPYEFGAIRHLNYNGTLNKNFTGDTFDCSSFIQYIFYLGADIFLYGDSRSMSVQGETIAYNKIKRGDVIFMTSTSRMYNTGIERIGHVVIYLGDNMIMHTFGTGGVRIQIFSDFWRGRFIHAKRMI